jgi:hypothetical protein
VQGDHTGYGSSVISDQSGARGLYELRRRGQLYRVSGDFMSMLQDHNS